MANKRTATGWLLAALVSVALAVAFGTAGAGATSQAKAYPRAQTLITSGTQWGNIAGMNPFTHNNAAGMIGLVNETLLRYDPLSGNYIDWLAPVREMDRREAVHGGRPPGRQVEQREAVHRQGRRIQRQSAAVLHGRSGTTCG